MSPTSEKTLLVPVAIAVLGLLTAVLILAWPPRPADPELVAPWLLRLDQDGDGCLRPEELAATSGPDALFAALDGDRSGCVEPVELEALLTEVSPVLFERPAL